MWSNQSQSHLEQIIYSAVGKIVPSDKITGLSVQENRVLLSLNLQDLHAVKAKLEDALLSINPDLQLVIYGSGEAARKIRYTIAVASGKGGVGKSTVAVNLAFALSQMGLKVALLDADIYGPSVPHMLGLEDQPHSHDGKLMAPVVYEGVECMSMGLLVPKDQPAIWRGPMVIKALKQMLTQVDWGALDIMVIDMPPGTGDAQLTLAQTAGLAGVVIVSTPQDLALIDARKGWKMFQTLNIPVIGVVENMSTFVCPHCGESTPIFHHGGARQAAEQEGIPFLGEIPLNLDVRVAGDSCKPFVLTNELHGISVCFREIADRVWAGLNSSENLGVGISAPLAESA